MPIKDAFVWSTDQRSVVVETRPELLSLDYISQINRLQTVRGSEQTYLNSMLELFEKINKGVVDEGRDVVAGGNVGLVGVWAHCH
jgi:hypothetical protein